LQPTTLALHKTLFGVYESLRVTARCQLSAF
jgi:hypothetical protein